MAEPTKQSIERKTKGTNMSNKISAIDSIVGVMDKVSAVAKRDRNEMQKFNFRGIDAVVNAVGPALREVGGAVIPTILDKNYTRGVTKSGTPTVEVFLTVEFAWHGTDGGEPVRGVVAAESMDTSDKATAKAMSVALRTFLLQTLMLPTDERDSDADYHERGTTKPKTESSLVIIPDGFGKRLEDAATMDELTTLWKEAVAGGFESQLATAFSARKKELS